MKKLTNYPIKIGVLLCLLALNFKAQPLNIDSLNTSPEASAFGGLLQGENDTNKVKTLNSLSKALTFQSKLDSALVCSKLALELAKSIDFKSGIGKAYSGLGTIYEIKGNSAEALLNYHSMLKIEETIGDKHGIAWACGCIGRLYGSISNYSESLKYAIRSLKLMAEFGDTIGEIKGYLLIGDVYNNQLKYAEALNTFKIALNKSEKINYSNGMSSALSSIGDDYSRQGNYTEALKNYFSALNIAQTSGDKFTLALSYINIGICNKNMHKLDSAQSYLLKSLTLSKDIYEMPFIIESQKNISEIYSLKGDTKNAFAYYKNYIASRDSFINAEKTKQTLTLEMTYQFDKKQQELTLVQDKKDAIQKTILTSVICGLVLTFILSIFIFTGYKRKQKDNALLTEQKNQLNEKNRIIEHKQSEILASIRYAKRIQFSLITSESYIEKSLNRLMQ